MPEKITATPILVNPITTKKFLKGIFASPALIVISSAKAGTGLERINPRTLKLFSDFSASIKSLSLIIFFAKGLAANLPKIYPTHAPKFKPIQTTNDASAQPSVMPANVFVKPLGTGKRTSAVKAIITTMAINNSLLPAQSNTVSPYVERGPSKRVSGRTVSYTHLTLPTILLV